VTGLREICQSKLQLKGVHGETLSTQDLSEQPVLGIKEFPRTGSCVPVESHHWIPATGLLPGMKFETNVFLFTTLLNSVNINSRRYTFP